MRARSTVFAASLLFVALAVSPSRAQTPSCSAGDEACGREAFARGTESFDQGDFAAASAWYGAAAAADAHPAVLYNWAVADARIGKLVVARQRLDTLLADARTDAALRARAERERIGVEARVARVRFDLLDSKASRIELDGAVIDVDRQELPVDPGSHRIRVSSAGAPVFDQVVELAPGERLTVRVGHRDRAIDIVVVPGKGAPASTKLPPLEPAPREPRGLSPVYVYVGAGATLALAGLTLWSGLDVQRAHDDYETDLPELTQAEADDRVESGHRRELRTNLLLGATALSALGTTALGVFFVDWSGNDGGARIGLAPGGLEFRAKF